jgi:protein TonB
VDYAQSQRNPGKHLTGITLVIIFHIFLGWALLTGLGKKVIEVIKAPIETKIIEEVKPPPPDVPPPPPPPKLAAPPPPFIPPPEIQIQAPPPPPQQVITTTTNVPPPPQAFTPSPPAPPVQAQPAVRREYKAAYRVDPTFPPQAIRQGINGKVVAWVHVAPNGSVTQVEIKNSSNRIFDREVIRAMSQWKFNPEPVGFIGEYEINFNLKD